MSDKFDYQRYLASREWAERKEAIRKRSHGYCERCLWAEYESTHHLTYRNIGHEPLEDLLAVCNPCHAYLSAKTDHDPRLDLVLWIVLGPRVKGHAFDRFIQGVSDGNGRVVGGIESHSRKPRWVVNVETYFTPPQLRDSVGVSAGLLS